jgi:ArsR family transcriptional regulator
MDEIAILKALAHPVRLDIVRRLASTPDICACDFTEYFEISQPTVSAHLRTLRQAGVVSSRRDGTTICYSLVPGVLAAIGDRLSRIDILGAAPAG